VVDGILPDYAIQLVERLEPTDHKLVARLQSWVLDSRQPLDVRIAAIKSISLSKHDPQGCVDWLAALLGDASLQTYAAEALSELGKSARNAESQLISAIMASRDESFQIAGTIALPRIAGDSPAAAQFAIQWLASTPQDSPLLPFLLDACAQFEEIAMSAIPIVRQSLLNSSIDARLAAVRALRRFGNQSESALPELMAMLTSTNEEAFIRAAASRAIGAIGPAGSSALLLALEGNAEPTIQVSLLRALAVTGVTTTEAQSVCLRILNSASASAEVRAAAALALGSMGQAAQPTVAQLLFHCAPNEDLTVHAMCLLAAARIDPAAAKSSIELGLESESTLVRTNAAFALHLGGENRRAFDSLLSMINDCETDLVVKQLLRDLGNPVANWLHEQAENPELYDVQRLACCELACELDNPDWSRLLMLVEDSNLGQEFADLLSFHWHPMIACNIDQHLPEVEVLLELTQSAKLSAVGRARLSMLLSPDGLGAGDDEEDWGGLTLSQPAAIETLRQADEPYRVAAAIAAEAPASAASASVLAPAKGADADAQYAAAISAAELAVPDMPQAAEPSQDLSEASHRKVEVYYGTNRQREVMSSTMKKIIAAILAVTVGSTFALTYCALHFFSRGRRIMSLACLFALAVFGSSGVFAAKQLAVNPLESKVAYNHRHSSSVAYGKCIVSIPPNHQPGEVESPVLWKAQLIVDPRKHVMLEQVKQLSDEDFFDNIKQTQERKGKNLLVFIHGYNVSFDDAAKRTAQMAFDLDFPGAAIFYSWPSQADWYGYKTDKRQIEMSVNQIKSFLEDLARNSGAETINLVAHSMGNLGLTAALQEIDSPKDRPLFNQVVLAAPDVDVKVFKRDIAPRIVSKAKRMTLYTSKTDLALIASRFFNQGSRLGDSGPEVVTFPGIETIDATTVDSSLLGHSYYGSNVSVLTDVGHLLRNEPIAGRSYLRRIDAGGVGYWTFDPVLISRTQSLFDGMMKK
jgi:esterase/lipase superfamily enzyme